MENDQNTSLANQLKEALAKRQQARERQPSITSWDTDFGSEDEENEESDGEEQHHTPKPQNHTFQENTFDLPNRRRSSIKINNTPEQHSVPSPQNNQYRSEDAFAHLFHNVEDLPKPPSSSFQKNSENRFDDDSIAMKLKWAMENRNRSQDRRGSMLSWGTDFGSEPEDDDEELDEDVYYDVQSIPYSSEDTHSSTPINTPVVEPVTVPAPSITLNKPILEPGSFKRRLSMLNSNMEAEKAPPASRALNPRRLSMNRLKNLDKFVVHPIITPIKPGLTHSGPPKSIIASEEEPIIFSAAASPISEVAEEPFIFPAPPTPLKLDYTMPMTPSSSSEDDNSPIPSPAALMSLKRRPSRFEFFDPPFEKITSIVPRDSTSSSDFNSSIDEHFPPPPSPGIFNSPRSLSSDDNFEDSIDSDTTSLTDSWPPPPSPSVTNLYFNDPKATKILKQYSDANFQTSLMNSPQRRFGKRAHRNPAIAFDDDIFSRIEESPKRKTKRGFFRKLLSPKSRKTEKSPPKEKKPKLNKAEQHALRMKAQADKEQAQEKAQEKAREQLQKAKLAEEIAKSAAKTAKEEKLKAKFLIKKAKKV